MTDQKFSTVVLLGNKEYMSQFKNLESKNVIIHADDALTFGELRNLIAKKQHDVPHDTLWLAFTGVQSITSRRLSQPCHETKCSIKLNTLELDETCLTLSCAKETLRELISLVTDVRSEVKLKIPPESDFYVMPPIPISLLPETSFKHEDLHNLQSKQYFGQFVAKELHVSAIKEVYSYVCRELASSMSNINSPYGPYEALLSDYSKKVFYVYLLSYDTVTESPLVMFHQVIQDFLKQVLLNQIVHQTPINEVVSPENTTLKSPKNIEETNGEPQTKVNSDARQDGINERKRRVIVELCNISALVPHHYWHRWLKTGRPKSFDLIKTEAGLKTSEPVALIHAKDFYHEFHGFRVLDKRIQVKFAGCKETDGQRQNSTRKQHT